MMPHLFVIFCTLTLTVLGGAFARKSVSIPQLDSLRRTCGRSRLRGGTIVGGVVAGEAEFPWIVSLQMRSENGSSKHSCGASIISNHWILSAAHCLIPYYLNGGYSYALEHMTALVGTNNIYDGSGDRYELEQIVVHEGWDSSNFRNDIALLRTKKKMAFRKTEANYKVNAVCLPPYSRRRVAYPPERAVVAGWGYSEADNEKSAPSKLLKVEVGIADHQACYDAFAKDHHVHINEKTICYGKGPKDACQGDSGGPLTAPVGPQTYQIGIVSFGSGCGSKYPGGYSEVKKFRDWIADNIY